MSMNARKRVLLIGGTGTLGGSTYPELLRLGYDVDAVSLEDFSSGAVCLVLASELFDEDEYIYDYDEFVRFTSK